MTATTPEASAETVAVIAVLSRPRIGRGKVLKMVNALAPAFLDVPTAAEREAALKRIAVELTGREIQLAEAERASPMAGREEPLRSVVSVSSGLPPSDRDDAAEPDAAGHILFLSGEGYRVIEREGRASRVDALVEVDGKEFVVTRVGRSPLPGDRRACAYLEPARSSRHA